MPPVIQVVPDPHTTPMVANEPWVLEMIRQAHRRISSRWTFVSEDEIHAGLDLEAIKEYNPTTEAVGVYDPCSFSNLGSIWGLAWGTEHHVIRERRG